MKKILALLLAAMMAMSLLVACGDNSSTVGNTGSDSSLSGGLVSSGANGTDSSAETSSDTDANTDVNSATPVVPDGPLTKEILVGSWAIETSLKEMMQTPDEMDAALTFYMVFTEDDKVKMFISEDALFEALEEAIRTLMTRAYIANQMGIAEDQLDATLAAQGMTYQSFVDTTVETGLSDYRDGDNRPFPPADSEGNVVLSDGYYKLENEKLYISTTTEFTEDQGASFSYDKGVLTITEDGAQMEMKKQ